MNLDISIQFNISYKAQEHLEDLLVKYKTETLHLQSMTILTFTVYSILRGGQRQKYEIHILST